MFKSKQGKKQRWHFTVTTTYLTTRGYDTLERQGPKLVVVNCCKLLSSSPAPPPTLRTHE